MKEVVINKCFGGFSLSPRGLKEYLKLKGKNAYFYKEIGGVYTKVGVGEKSMVHCVTKDLGKRVTGEFSKSYGVGDYVSTYDIPRDDSDLIKVVKKLGKKSWGECAELKIVEIPKNVRWTLDEYDGMEHIDEEHRTWS